MHTQSSFYYQQWIGTWRSKFEQKTNSVLLACWSMKSHKGPWTYWLLCTTSRAIRAQCTGRDIKTRYFGSILILRSTKDQHSIKHDRMQLFFKEHSCPLYIISLILRNRKIKHSVKVRSIFAQDHWFSSKMRWNIWKNIVFYWSSVKVGHLWKKTLGCFSKIVISWVFGRREGTHRRTHALTDWVVGCVVLRWCCGVLLCGGIAYEHHPGVYENIRAIQGHTGGDAIALDFDGSCRFFQLKGKTAYFNEHVHLM